MSTALVANNLPIPTLGAIGSLDAYVSAVHQIPVLTLAEEQALATSFRERERSRRGQEARHVAPAFRGARRAQL